MAAALVAVPVASAMATIKITKIQYDPPGDDSGTNASLNREFVIIKNTGNSRVTLTEWTLRDSAGHVFTFGTFPLRGSGSVTIHTGSGNDDRNDLFQDSDEYIWNNDGDTATLRNDEGNRVDRCRYPGGGDGSTAC